MQHEERLDVLADEYTEEGRKAFAERRMEEAVLLVQNASHLYKENQNYLKYAMSMNMLGVIYASMGNETTAVDYYLDALEVASRHKCNQAVALIYNNIGSRYQELKEYKKAVDYFKRTIEVLERLECRQEERFKTWCFIAYLNLTKSYLQQEKYMLAWDTLELTERYLHGEILEEYRYSYLIIKCNLYWCMGKKEEVYKNMDVLLECAMKNPNTSDYEENIKDICSLFQKMGEYEKWKQVICFFEENMKNSDSVYFRLVMTEMWMDYYQTIGNRQKYVDLCVEHAELYHKQKRINDKERSAAIDMKIELREKEEERKRAEKRSNVDALTGLGNRYLLEKDICSMLEQTVKQHGELAIGVLDVDCFKAQNDAYGHIHGDNCLKEIASIIKKTIKGKGKAYRFGGDEFVLLINGGEKEKVRQIAEEIKQKVQMARIRDVHSAVETEITVSQGYAILTPGEQLDQKKLISYADRALYYVKENGRNGYHIINE